jgi:hypothetical protein
MDIDLCRLYRIILVVDGGGRAGEVVDFVNFHIEGKGDVMAEEFKIGAVEEMGDISLSPSVKIIHTENIISFH